MWGNADTRASEPSLPSRCGSVGAQSLASGSSVPTAGGRAAGTLHRALACRQARPAAVKGLGAGSFLRVPLLGGPRQESGHRPGKSEIFGTLTFLRQWGVHSTIPEALPWEGGREGCYRPSLPGPAAVAVSCPLEREVRASVAKWPPQGRYGRGSCRWLIGPRLPGPVRPPRNNAQDRHKWPSLASDGEAAGGSPVCRVARKSGSSDGRPPPPPLPTGRGSCRLLTRTQSRAVAARDGRSGKLPVALVVVPPS
jgi:hypothetical protein